ncbi:XF1762 family protein [Raoultella scottii]|uniref:XF1762 family protein n=1 Tax=Raoultella scottii TaxID=3040937 RepID=UPI003D17D42F
MPTTFRQICAFVSQLHRHNKSPAGDQFSIGLLHEGVLVGVSIAGRPVARFFDAVWLGLASSMGDGVSADCHIYLGWRIKNDLTRFGGLFVHH